MSARWHTGKLIPWRLLGWACKRFGWCWASCVDLKLYGPRDFIREDKTLRPTWVCFKAYPEPTDYCGWHQKHPILDRMKRERAEAAR